MSGGGAADRVLRFKDAKLVARTYTAKSRRVASATQRSYPNEPSRFAGTVAGGLLSDRPCVDRGNVRPQREEDQFTGWQSVRKYHDRCTYSCYLRTFCL